MKTKTTIRIFALSIIALSVAACLFAGQTSFPDIMLGAYSIVGLLCIAAVDYSPGRSLTVPRQIATTTARWTHLSHPRSNRSCRTFHSGKITA